MEPRQPSASLQRPLVLLVLIFLTDQAHKTYFLKGLNWTGGERIELLPFLQHVLVWNEGISYGLLGFAGKWPLIGLTAFMIVLLTIWMFRNPGTLAKYGLAMAIGGAAGNLLDRILYGAVADFFHFHYGTFSWYVFNIADIAIFAGAGLLVASMLFDKKAPEKPQD